MKKIILDGTMLGSCESAHPYLKEKLGFPEYYGNNLDALYDCLTEMSDTKIIICLADQITPYFRRVLRVFNRAVSEGCINIELQ